VLGFLRLRLATLGELAKARPALAALVRDRVRQTEVLIETIAQGLHLAGDEEGNE
jgi:hypothetical protein